MLLHLSIGADERITRIAQILLSAPTADQGHNLSVDAVASQPLGTIERSAGKARRVIDKRPKG